MCWFVPKNYKEKNTWQIDCQESCHAEQNHGLLDINELETYEERKLFLDDLGLEEPGAAKLIRKAYQLLKQHTYFTAGEKEVRAWTINLGATAPQAAGVIHTDFEKGFIRAEVISYEDYTTYETETKVKEAGRMRVEGKEYTVVDGDVMHFRFNV